MKGFLWIAACGAAAMTGAAVRGAPDALEWISSMENGYVWSSDDGRTVTIGGDPRAASEHDTAKAEIEAMIAGTASADAESVTSADLEASINDATQAITAANERIAEIEADESLSDEDRAAALAEAREARSAAINQLQQAVPGEADEAPAEEQIAGGIEQMVLGIVTAAEESGATVSRDGEVLSGEERAQVFDEARAEIREEFDNN